MPHIIEKLLTRAIILHLTSPQSESTQEITSLQNAKSPNLGNFRTLNLGVLGQNNIWTHPMATHKEYYKGEGDGFPQIQVVVSFVSPCMHVTHPCTN